MNTMYIIAEMAWSHNGSMENALKIIDGAKYAGADAIGIHLTDLPTYMTRSYKCLAGKTLSTESQDEVNIYDYLEKIHPSENQYAEICHHANSLGLDVVAMCNDDTSFEKSKVMGITKYVVSAASFNEFELIKKIVLFNNDIILRIGGATLSEIDRIIEFILSVDEKSSVNILAGIQLYPTPIVQLHLGSIELLKNRYNNPNVTVGLADHIDGDNPYAIYLPGLACAYGIRTIEKHITTDRRDKLEDYEAALGIDQFVEFVRYLRTVESAIGPKNLDYLENDSYQRYRDVTRKRTVAAAFIKKGDVITPEKVAFKRSDSGEPLELLEEILGKTSLIDLKPDDGICKGTLG